MNSKILFAFFFRTGVSLINFLIIILTAKYLGAEIRGNISIILLAITFSQLVHQFIGGNPLIYFVKKTALKNLLIPTYIWALITSALVTYVLALTKQIPDEFTWHVFLLSIIQSLLASHLTVLLAYEKIKEQNLIAIIQAVIIISWLAVNIFLLNSRNIFDYINALYLSYGICFAISSVFIYTADVKVTNELKLSINLIKSILNYGLVIQAANIVQMLNYRLSYFLINTYAGTAALGVFSTAVAIGESVWLFSKSLTNVQYPKIVHATDSTSAIELTRRYGKAGLIGTLILLLPLFVLPQSIYTAVLGKDFSEIKLLLLLLSPGLLAMGFTTIYAHYFSGISLNRYNLFASGIGLIITCIAGYILIPSTYNVGACITADLSYLAASIILLQLFAKTTALNIKSLAPEWKDFKGLFGLLK